MKFIIKKNILTLNFIDKINNAFKEKRLIKSFLKKIYPYLKGIFYFVTLKKSKFKIVYNNKAEFNNEDSELIKKLFNFYKKMKQDQEHVNKLYVPSTLWQNHIKRDFSYLNNSIKNNSLENFKFFLQNFGNWNTDLGIFDHFSKTLSKNFILKKYLSVELFENQINLWNYFNQNKHTFETLNMPRFGNLNGAEFRNNFIVYGAPLNHIYSEIIKKYFKDDKKNRIVELGAGFGKLPYYYLRNLKNFSFIDFDIPEILLLASYYLIKSFPDKKYLLYNESIFTNNDIEEYELIFLPNWEIEKINPNTIDITVNKNSLGEIEPDAAKNYINKIHKFTDIFFSVNHEFMRNEFNNNKFSLINKEYNNENKFKELIRYPEIGHLLHDGNKINYNSDIFFYIYKKI